MRLVKNQKISMVLFLILIFSFFLRIYRIDYHRVWYDEVRSIATAEKISSKEGFFAYYKPLYFLILKLWINLFGIDVTLLRLLSVIFAIISIIFIYRIGCLIINSRLGIISAFLLSISCFHIYHSQQVRHFTFLVMLCVLSYFYLLKIWQGRNKFFLYNTFLNILIIFTHPYGLSVVLAQNLCIFLVFNRKKIKRWFSYQSIIFLSCIIWFIFSDRDTMVKNTWWIKVPHFNNIIETLHTFSYGGPRYGLDDFQIVFNFPIIINLIFLIFAVFLIFGSIKLFGKHRRAFYFLLGWLIIPILSAYIFSLLFFPVYLIKHLIICLPAFYLLVGVGICELRRKLLVCLVVVSIFLLNIYPLKVIYVEDYSIDWEKATEFLKNNIKPFDAILISPVCQLNSFLYYFRPHKRGFLKDLDTYGKVLNGNIVEVFKERDNLILGLKQNQNRNIADFKKEILEKINILKKYFEGENVWLLVDRWTDQGSDEENFLVHTFSNVYHKEDMQRFYGINVYKFKNYEICTDF